MVWLLKKCEKCSSYTLKRDICPYCGGRTRLPHPPKFSPDDKYLRYKMLLKWGVQQSERDFH